VQEVENFSGALPVADDGDGVRSLVVCEELFRDVLELGRVNGSGMLGRPPAAMTTCFVLRVSVQPVLTLRDLTAKMVISPLADFSGIT
jgi:hypothetical protein